MYNLLFFNKMHKIVFYVKIMSFCYENAIEIFLVLSLCRRRTILSINEKLPLTRIQLTQEHIWIFLDRELRSVQLSFLWCTVL